MHPTVTPAGTTAPDVYDDRTRHACVTRGEGSCVPTEPGGRSPSSIRRRVLFFLLARAELSLRVTASDSTWHKAWRGFCWDRRENLFIFGFILAAGAALGGRVEICSACVGCDGIRHSRVISSCTNTLLPLRVCPASMYTRRASCPAGLGSASDLDDSSQKLNSRVDPAVLPISLCVIRTRGIEPTSV